MTNSTKQALRLLTPFLAEHRLTLSAVIFLLFINSAVIIGVGFGAKYSIDNLPQSPDEAQVFIDQAVHWTLLAILLGTCIRFAHSYLLARTSTLIIESIRRNVFSNISRQSISFFDRQQSGDMQTRIIADINVVGQFVSTQIPVNLAAIVRLAGGIVGASIISLPLTLAVMLGLPLMFSPFFIVARVIRSFSSRVQSSTSELGRFTGESFRNAKINHAYNRQAQEIEQFSNLARNVVKNSLNRVALEQSTSAVINGFAMAGAVLLLWYCAQNIYSGGMSTGMLVSFAYFVYMVAVSASKLVNSFSSFNSALGAADKVVTYLALDAGSWHSRKQTASDMRTITFTRVSFKYPNRPDTLVLNNLSVQFPLDKHLAIVGTSGAGKSTVFELILRFYQTNSGEILVDGQDINGIDLQHYRSLLGYVPQKESMVSGTVLDNIRFGNPAIDLDEARQCAKVVGLDDFILRLPAGYDTELGEVASRLSGGQKQRLALARALSHKPKLLLLDEANSALDAESDRSVARGIRQWAKANRTGVITIAHRLETAKLADKIYVFDGGKLVAEGKHDKLVTNCEAYRNFLHENDEFSRGALDEGIEQVC